MTKQGHRTPTDTHTHTHTQKAERSSQWSSVGCERLFMTYLSALHHARCAAAHSDMTRPISSVQAGGLTQDTLAVYRIDRGVQSITILTLLGLNPPVGLRYNNVKQGETLD